MSIKKLQKAPQKRFSSEINAELLNQVKKLCKKNKIKFKQALEYSLKKFIDEAK